MAGRRGTEVTGSDDIALIDRRAAPVPNRSDNLGVRHAPVLC
jgi:hypothetical protein